MNYNNDNNKSKQKHDIIYLFILLFFFINGLFVYCWGKIFWKNHEQGVWRILAVIVRRHAPRKIRSLQGSIHS